MKPRILIRIVFLGVLAQDRLELPAGSELILGEFQTSFRCPDHYGYFADVDSSCKVFHICQPNNRITHQGSLSSVSRQWSFFCGNQTVFNQLTLSCSHEDESIPCAASPDFFYLNDNFGQADTNSLTDKDIIKGRTLLNDRLAASSEQTRSDSIIPGELKTTTAAVKVKPLSSTRAPEIHLNTDFNATTRATDSDSPSNIIATSKNNSTQFSTTKPTKVARVVKVVTVIRPRQQEVEIQKATNTTTTVAIVTTTRSPRVQATTPVSNQTMTEAIETTSDKESLMTTQLNATLVIEKEVPVKSVQEQMSMSEIQPAFEKLKPISMLFSN